MSASPIDIERNMRQFHLYALRTLHLAALAAYTQRKRRAQKELPFSDLPVSEINALCAMDTPFTKDTVFKVLDYNIVVQNDELADALNRLPDYMRDILLLKYFLRWTDRQIGELQGQYHFTIQKRRQSALKRLHEIYEQDNE